MYCKLSEIKELADADLTAALKAVDVAAEARTHSRPETADRLNREACARVRIAGFAWMSVAALAGVDTDVLDEAGKTIEVMAYEAEALGDKEAEAEFLKVAQVILAGIAELDGKPKQAA